MAVAPESRRARGPAVKRLDREFLDDHNGDERSEFGVLGWRCLMRQASVASLKARLSEYLAAVKAGEEILVTERGRPVARLGPVGGPAQREARVSGLVRAGLARPAARKLPADFWSRPRAADPKGRVLAALIAERAAGR